MATPTKAAVLLNPARPDATPTRSGQVRAPPQPETCLGLSLSLSRENYSVRAFKSIRICYAYNKQPLTMVLHLTFRVN